MKWSILQRIINLTVFLVLNENIGAQAFTLKGTIENRDTGYVILRYFRDASKQRQSDTVAIKNGKFQFTGTVAGADFALVQADTIYGIQLFIEPKIINIAFTEENSDKTLISGSKSQREYEALQKYLINERTEMHRISKFYKNIDSLLKNGLIDPKEAEEKRRGVNSMYNPVVRLKSNKELSFIKKHPNSYVSL